MMLAVASGKGGTGKTTVAVNLALTAPRAVCLLDCDVEEPNAEIFLKPEMTERKSAGMLIPAVDENKCNACGECGKMCQYHAIVSLKTRPLVFPELCHGCGGCAKVCPTGAVTEIEREIGIIEAGRRGEIQFVQGKLNIGHPMSPPLIRAVKRYVARDKINIIDCPPGTSCPVIAALRDCDCVLLVTEPTPFGLHDLTLAVETVRRLVLPFGVAINRADVGDNRVVEYCQRERIPILLKLPEDRRIAAAYSRGTAILESLPEYRRAFERLWDDILTLSSKFSLKKGAVSADV